MNLTRLRNRRIDHDNIDDLVAAGLITPEQAEAITEEFERNLQIAMETKGYATPADLRPIPISEFLRRLSGSKSHAGAGGEVAGALRQLRRVLAALEVGGNQNDPCHWSSGSMRR